MAGIESVRESHQPRSEEKAFIGILRASELIPYDSAIFLSTDRVPQNAEFSQEAAIVLLKKRIRVSFMISQDFKKSVQIDLEI